MSEWKEFRLSEIMDIIGGGTPKTSISEYWGGDIPWLSVVDFGNGNKFVKKTEKNITELGLKNSSTKILKSGQIIISARGTVGELAMLKGDMAFNQSCYGLNAKKDICSNNFLYYLLKIKISELKSNAHGAVFDTITRSTFETINVLIPSLEKQSIISEILSSLDDKIELNNKINQELESLAQTLFKQWFIDFEFPNENGEPYKSSGGEMIDSELGEIPMGWRVNTIESLTEKMNSGGTPSTRRDDYYDGNIKWFSTKELKDSYLFESERMISQAGLDNSSAKVFPVNTVLMAIYAAPTVGRLGILTEEATFNQAALGFIAKEEVGFEYVFLLLKHLRDDLNNLANGAAQQNLNVGLVKNYNTVHPTYDLLSSFRQIVSPLFLSIKINQEETNTLKFTRDNLLPKLISGELEINEISN